MPGSRGGWHRRPAAPDPGRTWRAQNPHGKAPDPARIGGCVPSGGGENPPEVVGVELVPDGRRPLAQRGLEASDRVPPALDVRIVRGEQVELLIRLVDEAADLLEDERGEGQL